MNPFGSPGDDEWIFSLDQPAKTGKIQDPRPLKDDSRQIGAMSIMEKQNMDLNDAVISPVSNDIKRFKRPQSAKTAFINHTGRFQKNVSRQKQDYATCELGKIFNKTKNLSIRDANSSMSKPPLPSALTHYKRMHKPSLKSYKQYNSLTNVYNSEQDYQTTISTLHQKQKTRKTFLFSVSL